MAKKVRWAFHDRAKFGTFIGELRQCIEGLKAITDSPASIQTQARLIREEVRSIKSGTMLGLVAESTAGDYHDWSDATSELLEASELGENEKQRISDWIEACKGHREARSFTAEIKRHQGTASDSAKTPSCNNYPNLSMFSPRERGIKPYFVPGDSLCQQVMLNNIKYFLGPQATVRPFSDHDRDGYLIKNASALLTKVRAPNLTLLHRPLF